MNPEGHNRLASVATPGSLSRSSRTLAKAKKRQPVTAVIGFCVKDTIYLATDSQMTESSEGTKHLDSRKINSVEFSDGSGCMFAQAGAVSSSALFREIFMEQASMISMDGARTAANIAEASMKKAKEKLMNGFSRPYLAEGEGQEYLAGMNCLILLAYCWDHKPYMYLLDLVSATAFRQYHPFVAAGSGRGIAAGVLEGIKNMDGLKEYEALGLAFYTIEMCKRNDLYCSGDVQSARVGGEDYACKFYDKITSEKMHRAVSKTHDAVNATLAEQISRNFSEDGLNEEWP